MLGAFGRYNSSKAYDMDGNDISDVVTENDLVWHGTVEVKDFTITDNGTTKAPTPPNNNSTPNITPVNRVKYIRPKKRNDLFKSR